MQMALRMQPTAYYSGPATETKLPRRICVNLPDSLLGLEGKELMQRRSFKECSARTCTMWTLGKGYEELTALLLGKLFPCASIAQCHVCSCLSVRWADLVTVARLPLCSVIMPYTLPVSRIQILHSGVQKDTCMAREVSALSLPCRWPSSPLWYRGQRTASLHPHTATHFVQNKYFLMQRKRPCMSMYSPWRGEIYIPNLCASDAGFTVVKLSVDLRLVCSPTYPAISQCVLPSVGLSLLEFLFLFCSVLSVAASWCFIALCCGCIPGREEVVESILLFPANLCMEKWELFHLSLVGSVQGYLLNQHLGPCCSYPRGQGLCWL